MANNQQNVRIPTINPCDFLPQGEDKKTSYMGNDMLANNDLMYNIHLASDNYNPIPSINFGSDTTKNAVITDHKQYDQGHHLHNNVGFNNENDQNGECCDCCYGDCDLCIGDDCCNSLELEGTEGDCCIIS